MDSLYIVSTPYHFLLACTIAAYSDRGEKKILVLGSVREREKLIECLKEWKNNPFEEIICLEERTGYQGIRKVNAIRKNISLIKKIINRKFHTFIFDPDAPDFQSAAVFNSRQGGINSYCEDGISSYIRSKVNEPFHRKIVKKIVYGLWFERHENHTDSPLFQDAYLVKPEMLPKKRDDLVLWKIMGEDFRKLKEDKLIDIIGKKFEIDIEDVDIVVMLPKPSKIRSVVDFELLKDTYKRLIRGLVKKGYKIAIKYHPQEEEYLGDVEVVRIPRSVASEIFFFKMDKNQKLVGDITTALYTIKMINSKIDSISLVYIAGYKDQYLIDNFKKWNVKMPKTLDEALAIF